MSSPSKKSAGPEVCIFLPDVRPGGAERVNINLANELAGRGYQVDLLLMRSAGDLLPLVDARVRVVDLAAGRVRGALWPLVRYLRANRPSSLLACMGPLTVVAVVARAVGSRRTRLVLAEHTTWSASARGVSRIYRGFLRTTMRLAFPCADGIVAVSEGAAEDLAAVAGVPRALIDVIYNPIVGGASLGSVEQVPVACGWSDYAGHRILAVGTLKAVKDYETLLRAFAILLQTVDAKLLILGEGEERKRLEDLAIKLGVAEHVSLPGFVRSTEGYYRLASLHVLSSVGEGLPTVIVEALAQGVPVVSTDCPSGPCEILEGGRFGALVPVADAYALACAMRDSLLGKHDSESLRARAADFGVQRATDAYLELLRPARRQPQPVSHP